ncbi:unnamed protein product [Nippostrongylus brasiliensis]|uniref:G_PROTEIN_RECEP_F1_2 domain-containing protein n=1 Tax=Nippostrongylus brasiliensis TaxID=27835 RepID=A0A0N4XE62_NIPBR|nr:unnamed protein product [Nippostrongylus brasiliensis]
MIPIVDEIFLRRMSSPCHILIALTCSMDLLHEFGHFPYAYHYFGMTTIVQSDCFWIQILPFIGACAGSPLILVLGVDRFIAVCFPSRLVQCSIPQAFGPSAFALVNHVGFGIHIANVMIYMISYFVLRRSGANCHGRGAVLELELLVAEVGVAGVRRRRGYCGGDRRRRRYSGEGKAEVVQWFL